MATNKKPGKPAKKYSQAARLHDVIRILEARYGATVDELAEECQVHRRTIFRDLQAINDAGYPLIRENEDDGRVLYRFMTGFKSIPPITFSLDELMTLYLCRGQLEFLQGTPFHDDLDAIFGKIRSSLRPSSVAHLERIAEASVPRFQGVRNYSEKKEVLGELRKALLYQYRCNIRYAPPHRSAETYQFDPFTLLFFKDSLYLGGYAHNRKGLRLFLVDGVISRPERRELIKRSARLAISETDARVIEDEVRGELGLPLKSHLDEFQVLVEQLLRDRDYSDEDRKKIRDLGEKYNISLAEQKKIEHNVMVKFHMKEGELVE